MREFLARLRDRFRRREIEAAFDEEMQFHLESLEARHRARGLSAAEARLAARKEFGNAALAREDLRERAGFPSIEAFVRDLRFAARGLRHRPWLALGVVAVLGLGLGAATTLTGLTRAILFAPLPVPHPEEIHLVAPPDRAEPELVSYGTVRRLDARLPAGGAAGYTSPGRYTVQREGRPAGRVSGEMVTGNFFSVLQLAPAAGRLLAPADDTAGAPPAVVVSYAWAAREFGAPAAAVGQPLLVNRLPATIVGVVGASFPSTALGRRTDVWLPAALQRPVGHAGNAWSIGGDDRPNDPDWTREERVRWMNVILRLPSPAGASAALTEAIAVQTEQTLGALDDASEREEFRRYHARIVPAPGGYSGLRADFKKTGRLLGVLVGSVLLLACANVSGLLLVRTLARHRELGVRLALGAGRPQIARLAVAEALLLCLGGALAGWVLSLLLFPLLATLLLPGGVVAPPALDAAQLLLGGGLVLACTAVCGVGPALLIARFEPLAALAGHGGLRGAAGRIGRVLVSAQLALAVALVAVATALGAEIARTFAADPGFARASVLTTAFDARSAGYTPEQGPELVGRLDRTLRALPGVVDVGFSAHGILNGSVSRSGLNFRDPAAASRAGHFQSEVVRPGFFGVAGMRLLSGRDFTADDRAGSPPVALVSAAFVKQVFGRRDPLGQRFGYDTAASKEDMTIIGVVADAKLNGIRDEAPAVFYRVDAQSPGAGLGFIALRVEGSVEAVRTAAGAALARAEPGIVFANWRTLDERVSNDLGASRTATKIAATFATFAIVLAATGVAASLGYLVTLRQRELALRLAIGADPRDLRRGVLLDAAKLGLLGATAGLALAWLLPLVPVIAALLPARPDLSVGVIAAVVGIAAALAAGFPPARRAARTDPLLLLKAE